MGASRARNASGWARLRWGHVQSSERPVKQVLLAAPRGYCAGVDRAVVTVEKALELHGAPVYVRKEIVHNKHVVATLQARGAIFVDETDEVPEGALVVFSRPRRVARGPRAGGRAAAAHDRRHLPAGDQGPQRGRALRRRGLRDPADRPRGPRGGRGHDGRGARAHHAGGQPERRRRDRVRARREGRLALPDHAVGGRDARRRSTGCGRGCRCSSTRRATTSAMRPRTGRRRSRRSGRGATSSIVVGSANSSNSVRLVEVAREAGAGAAHRVDTAGELEADWFAGVDGRCHQRRLGARAARPRGARLAGRARLRRRGGGRR